MAFTRSLIASLLFGAMVYANPLVVERQAAGVTNGPTTSLLTVTTTINGTPTTETLTTTLGGAGGTTSSTTTTTPTTPATDTTTSPTTSNSSSTSASTTTTGDNSAISASPNGDIALSSCSNAIAQPICFPSEGEVLYTTDTYLCKFALAFDL
jgi:hypothetical protein